MPKMIQIRNVPDDVHRTLKVRAAQKGMSLSDYLLAEVELIAGRPTVAEWLDRAGRRKPLEADVDVPGIIREFRDAL